MKAYLLTTGALFGLLTAVHIWRATVETNLAKEPYFILITLISAALCVWGLRLFSAMRSPGAPRA